MIRYFVAGMPWITVIVFNILTVSVTMFYYLKGSDFINVYLMAAHKPAYNSLPLAFQDKILHTNIRIITLFPWDLISRQVLPSQT